MSSATGELIERGLRAWLTGDLDSLEAVFDPGVTLRTVPAGEWDCVGLEELAWLLRQRQDQGSAAYPLTVEQVDEQTVVVTSTRPAGVEGSQPLRVQTLISVVGGKVVAMSQSLPENPRTDSP